MSFTFRDGTHLSNGNPLSAAGICGAADCVAAVGGNCTRPALVTELISVIRTATEKPIIVYPNAGGRYDTERRTWEGDVPRHDWPGMVAEWRDLGATVIGGRCRVGPGDIVLVRGLLAPSGQV
jgi:homocysteine S-methyltransferase